MHSLEYCRKVLGKDNELSDENLATLRDQFYCLANLMLDRRGNEKKSQEEPRSRRLDRETLEERAAIIEFDGNLSRDEAEKNAVALALENDHSN